MNALVAGLRHSWEVARRALENERALARRPLARLELEFMPAAVEVAETPAPPLGRGILWIISALGLAGLAWSCLAELDVVAVAPGRVVPSGRVKVVQPLEPGIVHAIHVDDGQSVKAGDVLVELDTTFTAAERDRLAKDLQNAQAELARLVALRSPQPERAYKPPRNVPAELVDLHRSYLLSQWSEYQARLASITAQMAQKQAERQTAEADLRRLDRILPHVRERVEKRGELVRLGYVAQLDHTRQQQEADDLEGQRDVQARKVKELDAALAALNAQRLQTEAEFARDIDGCIADARNRVAAGEQELIKAEDKHRVQTLTASQDGVVQQLAVRTVGGVVTAAQQLMVIVPQSGGLEIEAMLANKDAGFVRAGQPVTIKVDSFPFTKYGVLTGRVVAVSADTVGTRDPSNPLPAKPSRPGDPSAATNGYLARIEIDRPMLESGFAITTGMSVEADIVTDKRRLIEYFTAPLQTYRSEAFRER